LSREKEKGRGRGRPPPPPRLARPKKGENEELDPRIKGDRCFQASLFRMLSDHKRKKEGGEEREREPPRFTSGILGKREKEKKIVKIEEKEIAVEDRII